MIKTISLIFYWPKFGMRSLSTGLHKIKNIILAEYGWVLWNRINTFIKFKLNLCSFQMSACPVYEYHEHNYLNSEYCTFPVLRQRSGWPALSDSRMKTRSVIVPGEATQTGVTHTHRCYWHGQGRHISQPYQNIKH